MQRNRAGLLWLVQAISGLWLVALLFVHMVANHFVVPGGLQTYRDVINYLANPLILALESIFLVTVTAHALLGVRAILFDMGLSRRGEGRVNGVLAALGLGIVAYGLWLTVIILQR